jgi:hypothetical protein
MTCHTGQDSGKVTLVGRPSQPLNQRVDVVLKSYRPHRFLSSASPFPPASAFVTMSYEFRSRIPGAPERHGQGSTTPGRSPTSPRSANTPATVTWSTPQPRKDRQGSYARLGERQSLERSTDATLGHDGRASENTTDGFSGGQAPPNLGKPSLATGKWTLAPG